MFLLTIASAVGVMAIVFPHALPNLPGQKGVVGFFAFGISAIVTGSATALLWAGNRPLQSVLGWAGTMSAIVCGGAVLYIVGHWLLSNDVEPIFAGAMKWRLAGIAICGLVFGGFGIAVLSEADGST
jgi:hypothetical protein